MRRTAILLISSVLAGAAMAQDSVSLTPCLPGDAVIPWADGASAIGSEQCNSYVVDLAPLTTSWGTRFGIAPIVKTSKTTSTFHNSQISAQAISARLKSAPFASQTYSFWNNPGQGINNNQEINTPGTPVSPSGASMQFCATFAEFGTTDNNASYNAVVGAVVNVQPSNPSRLFVKRVQAALNSCDNASNVSQFGLGSIDESANLHFRADGFGTAAACGLNAVTGNNIFRVNLLQRNCAIKNVVSNDFVAGGLFDKTTPTTTEWLVRNSTVSHNTPGIMPSVVTGGLPLLMVTNFNNEFVRGPSFGSIGANSAHLAPGVAAHRGNIAYTSRNCAALASTAGIAGILAKFNTAGDPTNVMNIWGLNAGGGVTGTMAAQLPALVTDNATGFTNQTLFGAGAEEFDHYHSQTSARGGNGQIALGVDQNGNLLAAAMVNMFFQPAANPFDWPYNYIAVARVNCANGNVQWTMAGYTDDAFSGQGKPILDGPGGTPIGRMCNLANVTGGVPQGPSVSAPMIDSVGNVWFLSAVEIFGQDGRPSDFDTALLRAVYNAANFSYQLELVLQVGDRFFGPNSGRNYRVNFMSIADNNSVDSATAWSGNISEMAHLGMSPAGLPTTDPRTLGGLVLGAEIVYDWDNDGTFNQCTGGGTGTADQDYNVLLYVAAVEGQAPPCEPCDTNCDGSINGFDIQPFVDILSGNSEKPCSPCAADTNEDGSINGFDIQGFVECLGG